MQVLMVEGERLALRYTHSTGKNGLNLLWTSSIPSVEEQQDWFHHRRHRVGSWSILSPVHMQKAPGKEGPLAFPLTWRVMPETQLCSAGKEL